MVSTQSTWGSTKIERVLRFELQSSASAKMFQSSSHGCGCGSSSPNTLRSSLSPSFPQKLSSISQKQLSFCNKNGRFHLPTLSISASSSSSSSSLTTRATRRGRKRNDEHRISSFDYLIRSLDLSSEVINKISKRKQFLISSISRADSVLALFRDYGFTTTQISTIFVACPVLLKYFPTNLRLKLDFFAENGVAGDALRRAILADPHVLRFSLERNIAPCFDFLADFFGNRLAIIALVSMNRGTKFIRNFRPSVPQNARILRLRGVPDSSIVLMMVISTHSIYALSRKTEEFAATLGEIEKMGFRRSSTMFVRGLCSMLCVSRQKWVSLTELFKRFGFTEQQVRTLFLKQPTVMAGSVKSLEERLTFLFHKVRWTYSDLATYPVVLRLSYGQRILPRFAVLELLLSRGLVDKNCIGNAFLFPEARFLNRFVEEYRETLPHLLEASIFISVGKHVGEKKSRLYSNWRCLRALDG